MWSCTSHRTYTSNYVMPIKSNDGDAVLRKSQDFQLTQDTYPK